ncbi:MAG TPA: glycosyl transferase [Anaerolineae bacterium]|nr:glycosyl transferase [Anaerolineae bacterium]HPL26910.1 glycosyl transferase [Anaerolineae bacterium]
MRYGRFDDAAREYVILRPDTPLPWINYLGQDGYFAMVSNTGGGYSFYRDARLRRVIRYRYNNAPADVGGRALYLRLADGDYWSPTGQPARRPLDAYECRHGLGYTRISSRYRGAACEVTYFVPLGQTFEAWRVALANTGAAPVSLTLFSFVEFCLWDAWDDQTNFQRNLNTGEVEVDAGGAVIYHKTEYRERRDHFAYLACSERPAGYDTQREAFLGPYRGFDRPAAVEAGACGNSLARGWAPVAAQQVPLTLAPGERREVIFLLGYSENPRDDKFAPDGSLNKARVRPVIAGYTRPDVLDAALAELRRYWEGLLGACQVHTPSVHADRMANTWNPYQVLATFHLSRSASLFESGIGRGIGFRDSCQDLLGFVQLDAPRSRARLLDLAATQLPSGGAYHQYQPLTKRGNNGAGSGFNDDPLWLVLAVAAYLKETGDGAVLDEPLPYDNAPGSETPLYEHLQRALGYTMARLGPHGLPQIGHADWNDCLNLNCFSAEPGESFQTHSDEGDTSTAESVVIAALFIMAAREMAAIARSYGRGGEAAGYDAQADGMARTVLAHGWDGAWFLRAYDRFGARVGSHECAQGRIFVEPQGLCAMAGIGLEGGQAARALEAVAAQLATEHGIVLHQPAYTRYHLNLGEISSYPPGYKENAGVFCHTNPWIMIAEARLGRGEHAFDYYLRINPSAREGISDLHRCEPYVYAQMIAGRDAPDFGQAKNSWLTGTAAWNLVAIQQWILGVRPEHDGLVIDPCIPREWDGFQVTRRFRGATYAIAVRNPRHVSRGVAEVQVDGHVLAGSCLPLFGDGQLHRVQVVMGQPPS